MKNQENLLINLIEYTDDKFIPIDINNVGNFVKICSDIKQIDLLPIRKLDMKFSEDTWNFAPLVKGAYHSSSKLCFLFKDVPGEFKDDIKFYVYWNITQNRRKKIQTLHGNIKTLRVFLKYLSNEYIKSLEILDSKVLINFFEYLQNKELSYGTISGYAFSIKSFLEFYSQNMTNTDMSSQIKFLDKETKKLSVLTRNVQDENKVNDIPTDYFNSFLSTCIKVMNSKSFATDTRGYAAMAVILSQTGLRVSQLCTLKVDSISEVSILNNTKTAYFLEYTVIKRQNGNEGYLKSKTIINELGYKAYKIVDELFKEQRKKFKTDYLFCPYMSRKLPVGVSVFCKNFTKFIFEIGDEIGAVNVADKYPELKYYKFSDYKEKYVIKDDSILNKYKDDDIISYPTSHQFRVHLCTELYYKNIPLSIIQHYMNHLSEDMTDYYVRRPEYSKKEDEYATAVLKTIIKNDTKPIGSGRDSLMIKINEFIEEGNFNVSKDIDTIISQLQKKMPIKEKLGGICIKSGPKRDCSKDAKSDEFYCAYGVCPNHFHLYTMVDITYTRCKAIVKAMEYNKSQGFTRQSQKEQNKLIHVTKNSLLPEVEQLNYEINRKSVNWIKENHPNLTPIIDNINIIMEEANSWIQK